MPINTTVIRGCGYRKLYQCVKHALLAWLGVETTPSASKAANDFRFA
jgi:hypothetical protein